MFTGPDDPQRSEFATAHGVPDTVYRAVQLEEAATAGVDTKLGLGGGNGGECNYASNLSLLVMSRALLRDCLCVQTVRHTTASRRRTRG